MANPGDLKDAAVDRLVGRRAVVLRGEITEGSARQAVTQILFLHSIDAVRPIRLVVDSLGGAVDASLEMIDVVRSLRNRGATIGTHDSKRPRGARR